jgi:hypothetical protein
MNFILPPSPDPKSPASLDSTANASSSQDANNLQLHQGGGETPQFMGSEPQVSENHLNARFAAGGAPAKNHFSSWCSRVATSCRLHFCKTPEERTKLLTDKMNNGNLDLPRLKELRTDNKITQSEFLNVAIGALKDQATEEKDLMVILCMQCEISARTDEYTELLSHCLTHPDLESNRSEFLEAAREIRSLQGLKGLCDERTINQSEFLDLAIGILKDDVNEEKGFLNILCDRCGILPGSDESSRLLSRCLANPDLRDVPILVCDIPQGIINRVDASKGPCANPDPKFCRDVMDAQNVKAMAEIFTNLEGHLETTNQTVIAKQLDVYKGANLFISDIQRCSLELTIGDTKVSIPQNALSQQKSVQENFQIVLDLLQKPKANGGAELSPDDALHVLKQVALAYRGQDGTGDGCNLTQNCLAFFSDNNIFPKFDGAKISMKFTEDAGGQLFLAEKMEDSPFVGFEDAGQPEPGFISSECRFKFPGDSEIRTQLPVVSTRKESGDQWRNPLRENPPKKVIFYGGNAPATGTA